LLASFFFSTSTKADATFLQMFSPIVHESWAISIRVPTQIQAAERGFLGRDSTTWQSKQMWSS